MFWRTLTEWGRECRSLLIKKRRRLWTVLCGKIREIGRLFGLLMMILIWRRYENRSFRTLTCCTSPLFKTFFTLHFPSTFQMNYHVNHCWTPLYLPQTYCQREKDAEELRSIIEMVQACLLPTWMNWYPAPPRHLSPHRVLGYAAWVRPGRTDLITMRFNAEFIQDDTSNTLLIPTEWSNFDSSAEKAQIFIKHHKMLKSCDSQENLSTKLQICGIPAKSVHF